MEATLVAAMKAHKEISTKVGSHPTFPMDRIGTVVKQLGKQVIVDSTSKTASVGIVHSS